MSRRKIQSTLLFLTALAMVVVFLVTGAGGPEPTRSLVPELGRVLGPAAGHPGFLIGAWLVTLLGFFLQVKPRPGSSRPFPSFEFSQLTVSGFALLFLALTIVGVSIDLDPRSLAVLFVSGGLQLLLALLLGVIVASRREKNRPLYFSAIAATITAVALGAAVIVFMGGA